MNIRNIGMNRKAHGGIQSEETFKQAITILIHKSAFPKEGLRMGEALLLCGAGEAVDSIAALGHSEIGSKGNAAAIKAFGGIFYSAFLYFYGQHDGPASSRLYAGL